MSRKEYRAIADQIRDLRNTSPFPEGWEKIAHAIAQLFQKYNPRFDQQKFREYLTR